MAEAAITGGSICSRGVLVSNKPNELMIKRPVNLWVTSTEQSSSVQSSAQIICIAPKIDVLIN
jgi:hypothetical protein